MAYGLFREAMAAYERGDDKDDPINWASFVYESLFEEFPYRPSPLYRVVSAYDAAEAVAQDEDEDEADEDDEDGEAELDKQYEAWERFDAALRQGRMQRLGGVAVWVGAPASPPTAAMLAQLRRIAQSDDAYGHGAHELTAPGCLRGAVLLASWLTGEPLDGLQAAHRELEAILSQGGKEVKEDEQGCEMLSLSERAAARIAAEGGDYATALARTAQAIEYILDAARLRAQNLREDDPSEWAWTRAGVRVPVVAPWLADCQADARLYVEKIKQSDTWDVHWPPIARACKQMSGFAIDFVFSADEGAAFDHEERAAAVEEMAYWNEQRAWAEVELFRGGMGGPDSDRWERFLNIHEQYIGLRERVERQLSEYAEARMRAYFFPAGRWEQLPDDARTALAFADKELLNAVNEGVPISIFIDLSSAVEGVLQRFVWEPASEWAAKQSSLDPEMKKALDALDAEDEGEEPPLEAYARLLRSKGLRDYLRSRGVSKQDIHALTQDNWVAKHLDALLREYRKLARQAQHYAPGDAHLLDLYAQSIGIGRKGVLPELLRVLAPPPRRRPPS